MSETRSGKMSLPEYTRFIIALHEHLKNEASDSQGNVRIRLRKDSKVVYPKTHSFLQMRLFCAFPSSVIRLGSLARTAIETVLRDKWKKDESNEAAIPIGEFMGLIADTCKTHVRI